MKIIIFLVILIAGVILIPDSLVGNIVNHLMTVSGDGEEGMDNFYFTILLVKVVFSSVIAFIALRFYHRLK